MFSGAINKCATCLTSLKAAGKSFLGLICMAVYWLDCYLLNHMALWRPHFSKDTGFVASLKQPKTELSLREASLHPTLLPPFCQCEHSSSHVINWIREVVHLKANPNTHTKSKKSLHFHLAQLPDPAHKSTGLGWGSRRTRWPMESENEPRVTAGSVGRYMVPQVSRELLQKNKLRSEERDSCAMPQFWQWFVP